VCTCEGGSYGRGSGRAAHRPDDRRAGCGDRRRGRGGVPAADAELRVPVEHHVPVDLRAVRTIRGTTGCPAAVPEFAVPEIVRVLRPGGELILLSRVSAVRRPTCAPSR